MIDTPRTDAFVREIETSKQDIWQALNSLQGFARALERELARVERLYEKKTAERDGEMPPAAMTLLTPAFGTVRHHG